MKQYQTILRHLPATRAELAQRMHVTKEHLSGILHFLKINGMARAREDKSGIWEPGLARGVVVPTCSECSAPRTTRSATGLCYGCQRAASKSKPVKHAPTVTALDMAWPAPVMREDLSTARMSLNSGE